MLGLIIFCSILKETSGQKIIHVFSSDAENAILPCYDAAADCTSTTWGYYSNRGSPGIELFNNGKIHDRKKHNRLSLGSDCSLNIYKTTTEDLGIYTCWLGVEETQTTDGNVYLHVLQVSPPSSQTQIRPGSSVTLSCQLYFYYEHSCETLLSSEGLQLVWVNEFGVNLQTDSRFQISSSLKHCNISLTTTLLNEDVNTEWRCQITEGSEVKTSVSYTVSYLASTPAPVNTTQVISAVTAAVAALFVLIVLGLIFKYRAGRKADHAVVISNFTPVTPAAADINGKMTCGQMTEDVAYAEVITSSNLFKEIRNVQSDDKVTYVAIRGGLTPS
ncbi:diverse immunoglobulin domain-containing protein 2.2 [Danio aesculapii]|uniref:diverse immunoglobulin domain-containing protein 2.2 n=1 Tax=Danio aesculapii TaxID=1142201 RepID=UPI0024BFB417|nr:diverse immunoglobulin domain-containing protein 2.2 [Danio aesculapii]